MAEALFSFLTTEVTEGHRGEAVVGGGVKTG
jgi:hypothetical protein